MFKIFSATPVAIQFVTFPYFCLTLKTLKKIFLSFLAVCILSFSGGLSIIKHYCGDTLKEVSLNKKTAKCCDKHEPTSTVELVKEACCLNQVSFFKTFEFEKQKTLLAIAAPIALDAMQQIQEFQEPRVLANENFSLPPPKLPVYKQVQHFLI